MMRTSEMEEGVFILKDFDEAMYRFHVALKSVWGAWTINESAPETRSQIPHWVETPLGLTESQAKQAVKVAVEAKTGQRVRPHDIVFDP